MPGPATAVRCRLPPGREGPPGGGSGSWSAVPGRRPRSASCAVSGRATNSNEVGKRQVGEDPPRADQPLQVLDHRAGHVRLGPGQARPVLPPFTPCGLVRLCRTGLSHDHIWRPSSSTPPRSWTSSSSSGTLATTLGGRDSSERWLASLLATTPMLLKLVPTSLSTRSTSAGSAAGQRARGAERTGQVGRLRRTSRSARSASTGSSR